MRLPVSRSGLFGSVGCMKLISPLLFDYMWTCVFETRRILICIHIKLEIYHVSEYRYKDWFRAGRFITIRPLIKSCKEPIAKFGFWFSLFVGESKSKSLWGSYRKTIFRSLYTRQFSLSGLVPVSRSNLQTPQGTDFQSVSGVWVFFAFAGDPGHPRRGYII